MGWLTRLAGLSALGTAAVGGWAVTEKVRVDARAHLAAAESLHEHGRRVDSADALVAAGERYLAALGCYTPLSELPGRAASGLAGVAIELGRRQQRGGALRLLDQGIAVIDSERLLFVPLGPERAQLERIRASVAGPPPSASVNGGAAITETEDEE